MTVTYTAQVASCKRFGCFWKLLFRWKGSIYKLLWPNLTVYIMMYSTLSVCYRFLLDQDQKTTFEKLSLHCQTYGDLIPVSFVLGFYISIVVKRWWDQYMSIPWPDPLAILVSAFICGQDERSRLMRRTIMRHANLSLVITLRMMCPTVKKRFPTVDHLVKAGFMLPNERKIFDRLEEKTIHPKYWLPLVWSIHILNTARREDRIKDDFGLNTLINAINTFRGGCGSLLNYDWISVPLVYTQVVTLAVYTYFLATLMGNQYLNTTKGYTNHTIDLVVPIFTLLQFFFYMGWLLVAETLVNPFGEDDDDFEVNWLIDRNLQVSYLIVDEVHEDYPELIKDKYWEEVVPTELPYTEATKQFFTEPFLGSTRDVEVPLDQRGFVMMSMFNEPDVQMTPRFKAPFGKERRETTPVQILSVTTPNNVDSENNSQCTDTRRSCSNSILNMLKKNIYGADSKQSTSSIATVNPRRKNKGVSKLSSSQGFSMASTIRKNFNDYTEDIFWMSDFSLAEPRKFGRTPRKNDPESGFKTLNDMFPLAANSSQITSLRSQSTKSQVASQTFEKNKMVSNSWHGQGFHKGEGQGEHVKSTQFQIDFRSPRESSLINQTLAQSPPRYPTENIESIPGLASGSGQGIHSEIIQFNHSLDILKPGHFPQETMHSVQDSPEELEKESEIVPLHQQILLEEQETKSLSRGNRSEYNTNTLDQLILEKSAECTAPLLASSDNEKLTKNVTIPSIEITDCSSPPNQNIEDILGAENPDTIKCATEPISFDKPAPTPAIVIPGSVILKDHLSIPVIDEIYKSPQSYNLTTGSPNVCPPSVVDPVESTLLVTSVSIKMQSKKSKSQENVIPQTTNKQ